MKTQWITSLIILALAGYVAGCSQAKRSKDPRKTATRIDLPNSIPFKTESCPMGMFSLTAAKNWATGNGNVEMIGKGYKLTKASKVDPYYVLGMQARIYGPKTKPPDLTSLPYEDLGSSLSVAMGGSPVASVSNVSPMNKSSLVNGLNLLSSTQTVSGAASSGFYDTVTLTKIREGGKIVHIYATEQRSDISKAAQIVGGEYVGPENVENVDREGLGAIKTMYVLKDQGTGQVTPLAGANLPPPVGDHHVSGIKATIGDEITITVDAAPPPANVKSYLTVEIHKGGRNYAETRWFMRIKEGESGTNQIKVPTKWKAGGKEHSIAAGDIGVVIERHYVTANNGHCIELGNAVATRGVLSEKKPK